MVHRLKGKVALVSGGASGMGASHARAIVANGGNVVIGDVNDDAGAALAQELGEFATYTHLDVTIQTDWEHAIALAESRYGRLNVLINNAGILNFGAVGEYPADVWRRTLDVNLTGAFLGTSAAVEALRRHQPASIINVSSAAGLVGIPGAHGYTASKFGLRGLTKSVALELAGSGIRANSIHPGGVRTTMIAGQDNSNDDDPEGGAGGIRRVAEPEEISSLVVFLASDESSFSTGSEFVADGGITAGHA